MTSGDPAGIVVRRLGLREYGPVWEAMRAFTERRTPASADELWLVQHPAVFTLGQAGRAEHLLAEAPGIAVVHSDRGGQVTYHGPGQIVLYTLLDLRRRRLGIRQLVSALEQAVIALLARFDVAARARAEAPGVYVGQRKVAALGLRVRRGCSYHGLSLNVAMDLAPFSLIDPCGFPGLEVTQTRDLGIAAEPGELERPLVDELLGQLGYNAASTRWEAPGADTPGIP